MNRLLIACALAACGVPPAAIPEIDPQVAEPQIALSRRVEAAPPPRPLYAATRRPLAAPAHSITSIHGGQITALAVTPDGATAVTADSNGAVRLWPTLDGTREPVVIIARAPTTLAIGRDGSELVIAGLDAVGQLELVRTSIDGREDERIAVEAPRPLVLVRALGARFVAVRDDHVVVAFDSHGTLVGELAPGAGERIVTIDVQHERALAVIARDRAIRGRWLELADRLTWGERTAKLPIDPSRPVMLAPSATRIAASSRDGLAIQIIDLASGKVVATPASSSRDDGDAPTALAFTDDDTLVVSAQFATRLWREGTLTPFDMRGGIIVGAGGSFVVGQGDALAISDGEHMDFLGYRVAGISDIIPRRDGLVATNGSEVVRIDRALHADRELTIPAVAAGRWHTTHLLDARHALVYADHSAWIVDFESTEDPVKMPLDGAFIAYKLDTKVLVLRTTSEWVFAQFDSKTGTFGDPVNAMNPRAYGEAFALDPKVTHGVVAVVVEPDAGYEAGPVTVTELRITDGKLDVGDTRSITIEKPFWDAQAEIATAVGNEPRATIESPSGDLVAVVEHQRLALRTAAGALRWSRRLEGTAVVWSVAGELFVYGNGMARIDLETGALAARQCGWQFGRYPEHFGSFAGAALCDAND